jgi:hypothetical protein
MIPRCLFIWWLLLAATFASDFKGSQLASLPQPAAGSVIVHGRFHGDIFGFDVDPVGSTGLLAEAVSNRDGTIHSAIETFDQTTGEVLDVLAEKVSQDDFVALGVFGLSTGLVENEHVESLFHVRRRFRTVDLARNRIDARWTPPLDRFHIVNQVKASSAGNAEVAVYAVDVSTAATPIVFSSNLSTNTFGPVIPITDPVFTTEAPPVIAFDDVRNQVILGHDFPSPFIEPPRIGFANLTTGEFSEFEGVGLGVINGIAVDTEDGVLCTDTSFDSGVQFYDLHTLKGTNVLLPGAAQDNSTASGADIAFDPVNKLFLVAQTFANGSLNDGSAIQVYDIAGNFVETIEGLNFQGGFNAFPTHISLHPALRTGFVNGPDLTKSLQSFSY